MTSKFRDLWLAYKLRWRRRKYIARAFRRRKELTVLSDKSAAIRPGDILCFSTVRNERVRLPFFLDHHRALGVRHFFFVDNGSDDGTDGFLSDQPDISVWRAQSSYKAARFGVDWINHLLRRYGHGHWCLTLDADEILTYPGDDAHDLQHLTQWLTLRGTRSFGAMMVDLYPKGALDGAVYNPGDPVWSALTHFDPSGYVWDQQSKFQNISIRGGPRARLFFADTPDHAPHLHKVPLVHWRRSYAYASSTHLALPRSLNHAFDARQGLPTGVLLHSKFLPEVVAKSAEEKLRAQHFTHPDRYGAYYDRLTQAPDLWYEGSTRYSGSEQLERLGLMQRGEWLRE